MTEQMLLDEIGLNDEDVNVNENLDQDQENQDNQDDEDLTPELTVTDSSNSDLQKVIQNKKQALEYLEFVRTFLQKQANGNSHVISILYNIESEMLLS